MVEDQSQSDMVKLQLAMICQEQKSLQSEDFSVNAVTVKTLIIRRLSRLV